jgi:hypothetical protein
VKRHYNLEQPVAQSLLTGIDNKLHPPGKDEYRFVISDNGVGFPKDLDFRNTESLGMQLVTLLVGRLEGTIDLKRKGGTTFDIVFKEQKKKKLVAGKRTFSRTGLSVCGPKAEALRTSRPRWDRWTLGHWGADRRSA